ncbi:MAG: hypothetical protein JNL57_07820 [Bacteroidetes bacterium]|nr:hypothetical protein [Bacteroidota bacterium]
MKTITICIASALIFLFTACNGGPSNHKTQSTSLPTEISKPTEALTHLNLPPERFSIRNNQPNRIETADGSEILISQGSFVFEDGTPVTGKVDIMFSTYNSPLEIIAAGIPMQVKYKGKVENFISDGMFNIQAMAANGKPVKIAAGKDLQIFTPVSDMAADYKYWYLEPTQKEWQETGTRTQPATSRDKDKAAADMGIPEGVSSLSEYGIRIHRPNSMDLYRTVSADEQEPVIVPNKIIPAAYDPKKATLDLVFNKKEYPELAEYSTVMWQFCGSNPAQDPQSQPWLFQEKWMDIKLKSVPGTANTFQLAFNTTRGEFKTFVRPVVSGQDLEKAKQLYDQFLKEDTKQIAADKVKKEGASARAIEKNMYNAFRVNRLGTYNCDRFYNDPKAVAMSITMLLENKPIEASNIYLLTDNKRNFITVSSNSPVVTINPKIVDAVICVAGTGAIAVADITSLQNFKKSYNTSSELRFKKINHKIFNMKSLLEALNKN